MNRKILIKAALAMSVCVAVPMLAYALEPFRNTVTGDVLDINTAPKEGRDTEGVKRFLETGVDPYIGIEACLLKGEQSYLSSCSGCHGHVGEGKVGPGLNDNYWTYEKNKTDKGLFETIFGGARSMMGPHNDLPIDETLQIMAWIRHIYTGPAEEAEWLMPDQKKDYTPYKAPSPDEAEKRTEAAKTAQCAPGAAS
jgi:cytochrome c-L